MSKVKWDQAKISSASTQPGRYRTFNDMFKKAVERDNEQRQANDYLLKAMPALNALLEYKLKNNEPLVVMRPLQYQTSILNTQQDEDDGFYANVSKSERLAQFVDVQNTIMPGTVLVLKALDNTLQEFIFRDGTGKEHCINFADKNKLLTQTTVFEEVKNFLENNK